jgi:hypothetical protein
LQSWAPTKEKVSDNQQPTPDNSNQQPSPTATPDNQQSLLDNRQPKTSNASNYHRPTKPAPDKINEQSTTDRK